MSDRETDSPSWADSPIATWVTERYETVTLVVLAAFMLWVRLRSYDAFVRDGKVFFSGNDPYYHLRQVSYTVRNWPATMPYDPWTYYPFGTNSNQFGTLYDQLVATAALVVGLGDPSQQTVALTLLVSPAVIGAILIFPTYYAGKRLGGVPGGLFSAVLLALLPGSILTRTLVGAADHQAIEALAQMTTVLAILVALGVAKEEKPVYELIVDRDFETLRRPVGWSALAGVAMGLYVWVWPPSILLIGVLGLFFAIKMGSDYYNGRSPEPTAFVAAGSMSVAGVLALLPLTSLGFSPTDWSLLQPVGAFGVAGGAVFLAWLAREWDDRDLDPVLYPLSIAGLALVGTGLVAVLLPGVWDTLTRNFQRILGFSAGATTRTIREAQPFLGQVRPNVLSAQEVIMLEYGMLFFTAMLALAVMLGRPLFTSSDRVDIATFLGGLGTIGLVWQFEVGPYLVGVLPFDAAGVTVETAIVAFVILVAMVRGDHDGEELFVAVWALVMTAAAFTQVRFNYYLALSVVVLNAYLLNEFLKAVDIVGTDGSFVDEVEPYQMMAVLLALIVVLPVLVMPIGYHEQNLGQGQTRTLTSNTAWEVGNSSGPGRGITAWDDSLQWMNDSTPREGTYGGADNSMDHYGTYEATSDFAYDDGTYGVMSWWDYGHWITVEGQRIPTANPFQQGARQAANFLLAPNETRANEVLARDMEANEETRYVVVDWQMADAASKFSAPTVFYDDANVSYSGDFVDLVYSSQTGQLQFRVQQQRYYESMMVRLYRFNGSRASPQPFLIDYELRETPDGETVKFVESDQDLPGGTRITDGLYQFRSVAAAERAMENTSDTTYQIGGLGDWAPEPVPAVEHYRLVHASESTTGRSQSFVEQKSRVKVFERVPGATVTGQGPANTTLTAEVEMHLGTRNDTFVYRQRVQTDEDGNFEMTLPYSSTGYDEWGPREGYTNTSVRATGPYQLTAVTFENETLYQHSASFDVTEAQVIGEDDSTVEVELERSELNLSGGAAPTSALRSPPTDDVTTDVETASQPATDGGQPVDPASLQAPATPPTQRALTGPATQQSPDAVHGGAVPDADGAVPAEDVPDAVPQWLFVALMAGVVLFEVRDDRGI